MSGEQASGALGGAAQGAAAGAAFGPWGAVIGGVIGAAAGLIAGGKAAKARMYMKKASAVKRQQEQMMQAIQRRDVVRQSRAQQANATAAGASDADVTSSAVLGAQTSLNSQSVSSLLLFDRSVGADNLYNKYRKKAGKASSQASNISNLLGSASDLVTTGQNIYGSFGGGSGAAGAPASNFNSTAAVDNASRMSSGAFNTYGSTPVGGY